jgi:hypothetical protein
MVCNWPHSVRCLGRTQQAGHSHLTQHCVRRLCRCVSRGACLLSGVWARSSTPIAFSKDGRLRRLAQPVGTDATKRVYLCQRRKLQWFLAGTSPTSRVSCTPPRALRWAGTAVIRCGSWHVGPVAGSSCLPRNQWASPIGRVVSLRQHIEPTSLAQSMTALGSALHGQQQSEPLTSSHSASTCRRAAIRTIERRLQDFLSPRVAVG